MLFAEVLMNDDSFQILDNLIANITDAEKLRKYYSSRASVCYHMEEWKDDFLRLGTKQRHSRFRSSGRCRTDKRARSTRWKHLATRTVRQCHCPWNNRKFILLQEIIDSHGYGVHFHRASFTLFLTVFSIAFENLEGHRHLLHAVEKAEEYLESKTTILMNSRTQVFWSIWFIFRCAKQEETVFGHGSLESRE